MIQHVIESAVQSRRGLAVAFAVCLSTANLTLIHAEAPKPSPLTDLQRVAEVEHRLNEVTTALNETQRTLEQSLGEIRELHAQLEKLRAKEEAEAAANSSAPAANATQTGDLLLLREEQEALQAEIKQHEQIKVETTSKYPLRVTGLVLFNAFDNGGVVDDASLPTYALPRVAGSSSRSTGATMSQTLLGLEATGPKIGGANSSAAVSMDFFAPIYSNGYGYNSPAGAVRMRQSLVALDWGATTVQAGYTSPLISPLSPTSYATVAQPALSGSGNLWVWSPQVRVEQRVAVTDQQALTFEAGLIYPQFTGPASGQPLTPAQASRRPGYEGRVSYLVGEGSRATLEPFTVGFGAYASQQRVNSATRIHSWAVTADWRIPIMKRLQLSGEAYRGTAIGGLGGSAYNDVLVGTDAVSGLGTVKGVMSVGGWSQLKFRFTPSLEANAMFGLDDPMSSNFEGLILYHAANPLQLYTRNSAATGNLIFRPKTYLILSPEYRRITTSRYAMPSASADVFTISAGYQF